MPSDAEGCAGLEPPNCDDEWNALATQCGGKQNIINWNDITCTGDCKPCVAEYAAKITECEGEKNIIYWDNTKCTGMCVPQNLGPSCEIQ